MFAKSLLGKGISLYHGVLTLPPCCRGHASENPELPRALAEKGIRFLGPAAEPMAALGDKVSFRSLSCAFMLQSKIGVLRLHLHYRRWKRRSLFLLA
jgi:pyruvate carboxylase